MTEPLNRDELIALLNRLGSEDDADVLQAARDAHARVAAADLDWEALLVPEDSDVEEPDEEALEEVEETPADRSEKNAESLALIGKLLAKKDISEDLRTELEDYKTDIAEGEFTEADRKYLRAVYQRLSK